jgi:hypothetical protein
MASYGLIHFPRPFRDVRDFLVIVKFFRVQGKDFLNESDTSWLKSKVKYVPYNSDTSELK